MPHGTLVAADLDTTSLVALLDRKDAAGVLSIFADVAPGVRGTEIDLRNRLTELERGVSADGPRELTETLARFGPELRTLVDPGEPGRGRALFVPLSGGTPTRLVTHLGIANRVVLDERPFIHPLLECLERGRPAGVVLLSNDVAKLLEWRDAQLLVVAVIDAEADAPSERPGPLVAGAARHQHTTPLREQHPRRARDRRRRFIEQAAAEVRDIAARRAWDRLVVSGSQALTRPLVRALPSPLQEHAFRDPRHLIDLESADLADSVAEILDRQRGEWDTRLAQGIRDAAVTGRGGALGLSEVTAALNDARVSHLIYDPEIRHAGALAADGRLVIPPERHPLGAPLTPEPRLTERMVERCLATGARVTPVTGAAATLLADAGGVAARLRW